MPAFMALIGATLSVVALLSQNGMLGNRPATVSDVTGAMAVVCYVGAMVALTIIHEIRKKK